MQRGSATQAVRSARKYHFYLDISTAGHQALTVSVPKPVDRFLSSVRTQEWDPHRGLAYLVRSHVAFSYPSNKERFKALDSCDLLNNIYFETTWYEVYFLSASSSSSVLLHHYCRVLLLHLHYLLLLSLSFILCFIIVIIPVLIIFLLLLYFSFGIHLFLVLYPSLSCIILAESNAQNY
jgi:hypothetical protein